MILCTKFQWLVEAYFKFNLSLLFPFPSSPLSFSVSPFLSLLFFSILSSFAYKNICIYIALSFFAISKLIKENLFNDLNRTYFSCHYIQNEDGKKRKRGKRCKKGGNSPKCYSQVLGILHFFLGGGGGKKSGSKLRPLLEKIFFSIRDL